MLNLPAILVALLVTWICYVGIRQSAIVNTIVVSSRSPSCWLVIGFGAFYVNPANWHPFIPPNTGTFGAFGWSGVLRASGIVFFSYIGFDAVSTAAQEAKNPARNMPIGILGSLLICTVLYILMSGVLTGLLPYPQLNDAAPVAVALGPTRSCLAARLGHRRRARRSHLRDPGPDAGAGAHLPGHGASWPAAAGHSARCIRASGRRTSRR